jgi:PqqD family protein of HPr-rel-A system
MKLKKYIALSESGVVFNGSTGDSFSANPVAMKIIELLQRGAGEQEIIGRLSEIYDVESERLSQDFYDFLGHLNQLNLVDKNG